MRLSNQKETIKKHRNKMNPFKIGGLVLGIIVVIMLSFGACETVQSGHKGVEVSWGGKTNMDVVHPEGMNIGIHWIYDDMIEYDVREKTVSYKFEFNDKNSMSTGVELSIDYTLASDKINVLHKTITDVDVKIAKTVQSAAKEVIPQYSAVELNITKRQEAEEKLANILKTELNQFYVIFARIRMTDVDIPKAVADLATETAVQLGRNELAKKKEAEQTALADAKVAEAQGNYDAGVLNAKTKDIMSQPKMLDLYRLENERLMWEAFNKHGNSPYGNNNIFGAETAIVRGLK
jgi:regulator of protease activity HflC (stomatin/prohibitin superfamily)